MQHILASFHSFFQLLCIGQVSLNPLDSVKVLSESIFEDLHFLLVSGAAPQLEVWALFKHHFAYMTAQEPCDSGQQNFFTLHKLILI